MMASTSSSLNMGAARRRRRLGDSVPGCLLMIALVLGGSIWGYFKFFHYSSLAKGGENYTTFKEADNPSAYLEYGRRMRATFLYSTRSMCSQNYSLIKDFKKNRWKDDPNAFDAATKEFINMLLESIKDFDGQRVPTRLAKPHAKFGFAHRYCYESTLLLREAAAAEGPERDRLVKEAEKKAKEAWKNVDSATREYNRIWNSGNI